MKHKSTKIFALICWLLAFNTVLASSSTTQSPAPNQGRTPVVVELFTSEGCSTCPPADELLARLEERQFVDGAEVRQPRTAAVSGGSAAAVMHLRRRWMESDASGFSNVLRLVLRTQPRSIEIAAQAAAEEGPVSATNETIKR